MRHTHKQKILNQFILNEELRQQISTEYEEVEEEIEKRIQEQIKVMYKFRNDSVIGVITLGDDVTTYIEENFRNGTYTKGLLADMIANEILFELDNRTLKDINCDCRKRKFFISQKMNIGEDLPLSFQKEIAEEFDIITVTDSYMLLPLKSITFTYLLTTEKSSEINLSHDCTKCSFRLKCNKN